MRRTNSIWQPPEIQLIECVKANDVPKIISILVESPGIVNTVICYPYNKPILHIACCEFADIVTEQTVEMLLYHGANLYYSDVVHNHKEALHFAALCENPLILETIINRRYPETINSLSGGNTALNLLIKEGDPENPNFLECIKILLEAGTDINRSDEKNLTPIFWAAKMGYKQAVRVILEKCKQDVDVDSHKLRGKSARDYITENNMKNVLHNLPKKTTVNNNVTTNFDLLFGFLKDNNEEAFVNCKYLRNCVRAKIEFTTLLHIATEKGLKRAVECLLKNGADPNQTIKNTIKKPIEIAMEKGYQEILWLFLEHKGIIIPTSILTELLKHVDKDVPHPDAHHKLYYTYVMRHKSKMLHYAVKCGGAEKTLALLKAGAFMGCNYNHGYLPIEDIDANTLETHLNECLEVNVDLNILLNIDKEEFKAIFNYRTLMPPHLIYDESDDFDLESAYTFRYSRRERRELLDTETQVISYISKSPDLKHLLKHPVITSFLYVKWYGIRWFFYTNLAFYVTFCLSLILYILLVFNIKDNQYTAVAYILSGLLYATFILLIFREIFQIVVSPKTYFLNLENLLEILLIVLTAVILFKKSSDSLRLEDDVRKQVSAIVILVAAFELVILIGQHPKMSTNIAMLRTVSTNFFKCLLWYSILIIAFSLSFYTLFKDTSIEEENVKRNNTGDDDPNFFVDPGISLFKTIVMLTGEFDAGSIHFQSYPITSHIIFMLFVFMIAIILFNLLNGLAVNDIQLIKSNAELVGHIARIEHITYIERMFLRYTLPSSILKVLHKCCCCLPLTNNIFLFPDFFDCEMVVYPNQHAKVLLPYREYLDGKCKNFIRNNTFIYLDEQTAKRTNQLIKDKKEILERKTNEKNILKEQELVIAELRKEQASILNKLDSIITNMKINV